MSSNLNISNVSSLASFSSSSPSLSTHSPRGTVRSLAYRLRSCVGSEDYVAVIRALVATRDPVAIGVLASLLDSTGPIAEESIAGLVTFGEVVVPAMRGCIDSDDYERIRHAHRVLAALGDAESKQWLSDDDDERVEAFLERKGISDVECAGRLLEAIANEDKDPEQVA
jgi:hypothetical protein